MRGSGAAWIVATALLFAAPTRPAWAVGPPAEGEALENAAEAEAEEQATGEPDPIRKQLIDDAVTHFKEGQRLFEERLYAEAAEEFRRSYESFPSGPTLYNESLAWEKAGEPAKALKTLDRYLSLPDCVSGELLCAGERAQASRASQKLKTQVGVLDIVLEPGIAIRGVEIDGELYGLTSFPLYAEPGDLEVVVVGTKEGQRQRVVVEMEANERSVLMPQPFAEGGSVIRPPRKSTSEQIPSGTRRDPELRRKRLRYAFYGTLGVTLASGTALAIVGGLLLDTRRDYNRRCTNSNAETGMCGMPDPNDPSMTIPVDPYPGELERRYKRLQPATTALLIVTAGLALTTVTLALFAFTKGDRSAQRASTRAQPSSRPAKPGAQFTGNGLQIRW